MADGVYLTQAHEHYYRRLKPNRNKEAELLMQALEERGASHMLSEARQAWAEWQKLGEADDWGEAMLKAVGEEIITRFERLGYDRLHLERICFGGTTEDVVSAQMDPYADDSALVLISDALFTLTNMYARFLTYTVGPTLNRSFIGRVFETVKLARPRRENIALFSGLLRYYNMHQRTWGLAGKLELMIKSSGRQSFLETLNLAAWKFILAHEAAHFALGHAAKSRRFNSVEMGSVEDLVPGNFDQQLELDADELAIKTLCSGDCDSIENFIAVLGAVTAIWATDSNERALFVRRGHTHPSGLIRVGRLSALLPSRSAVSMKMISQTLEEATNVSADYDREFPQEWWGIVFRHPDVRVEPHEPSYLKMVTQIDKLQCAPTGSLLHGQHEQSFKGVRGSTGVGAQMVVAGDVRGGLASWGVLDAEIDHVCDGESALSFYGLQEYIFEALDIGGEESDTFRRMIALSGATLVARTLKRDKEFL